MTGNENQQLGWVRTAPTAVPHPVDSAGYAL